MKCPSLNTILDYLSKQLSAEERQAVDSHLEGGCLECREQRELLATALGAAAEDKSFEFPPEAIARAVDWFKEKSVDKGTPFGEFLAHLIFDSLMPSRLAPVRSGLIETSAPAGRQVLYKAGSYDVDLRFERGEDTEAEDLIGQILTGDRLPTEIEGVAVRLLQDEIEVAHAHANSRGVFIFLRIASGIYELRILVPEGEITINRVASAQVS